MRTVPVATAEELWGVLNAVRVATRFGKSVKELLPRMDEVLAVEERPDDVPVEKGGAR